jgi:hypothetical protein
MHDEIIAGTLLKLIDDMDDNGNVVVNIEENKTVYTFQVSLVTVKDK